MASPCQRAGTVRFSCHVVQEQILGDHERRRRRESSHHPQATVSGTAGELSEKGTAGAWGH